MTVGEYMSVAKPGSDYQQLRAYSGWVYSAASLISRAAAMVDGHLLTSDDNEIETHPFLDLWAKPCRAWRGTEWRELFFLHRLLAGNFYSEVVTNGLRVPIELWPLAPDRTEIVPSPTDWIKSYRYTGNAGQVELEPERVLHSKRANPNSNYYGLSVVQAAARAVDLSNMYKDFALASLRNGATPKSIVLLRAEIEPGQQKAVEDMVRDSFKGVANAGRTAVVSKAVEDVKRISLSPEEMDYLAAQQFTRDEIFAIFGVHRSKAGMSDDINRANAEAADYTFKADVVAPELGALEDLINSELLPRYDSRLRWKFNNPVPDDMDRMLAQASAMYTQGWGTENEARVKVGMDERPEGERYAIPFSVNLLPVGQQQEESVGRRQVARAILQTASRNDIARQVGTVVRNHEAAMRSDMQGYFRAQKRRVAGRLRNELASWPDRTKAIEVASGLSGWTVRDPERARAGMDERDEERTLYELLLPLLIAAGVSGYEYIRRLSQRDISEGDVQRMAERRAANAADVVTATTVRQLLDALAKAETKEQALDLIEAVFDRAINARGPLVARIESSRMTNASAADAMREAGYEYKQWQTVGDDRVEEFCQANEDAGAVPMDERFPETGDYEPPTAEHPGCRCVLVPATAEDVGVTPLDLTPENFPEAFPDAAKVGAR